MVLKPIDSANLLTKPNIRLDADHALHQSALANPVSIRKVFTVGQGNHIDTEPSEPYHYCEIADVDRIGFTSPRLVDPRYPEVDPELRTLEEHIRRKVQQLKAMTFDQWCVLVPKTRPYLRKFAIVTGKEDTYFTTDLFVLEPGEALLEACHQSTPDATCLLILLLKGQLNPLLTSISRWGKSYPTLHRDDLSNAVIDQTTLNHLVSQEYVTQAKDIRKIVEGVVSARNELLLLFSRDQSQDT